MMTTNPALEYVNASLKAKSSAPKYVKKQCRAVKPIFEGKDKKYIVNEKKLRQIIEFLSLLKMPKGLKKGQPISECLSGFQWLIIVAALCIVHREEPKKRRYTNIILEIGRKNGKTFLIAVLFILLFFIEPKYSEFYSVAPDGTISKQVKKFIEQIINTNKEVFEMEKRSAFFKIKRDEIIYKAKASKYIPLNYSNSRLDSREPNVFLCDEVGALPNPYAFEAMRSGQIQCFNKLGFLISTKYDTSKNPFEGEIEHAKRVLDKLTSDETTFSLLFEPDEPKKWATDIKVLKQANPLTEDLPSILDELKKKRKRAIEDETLRENFLTKHCNIIYQGAGTESFVPVDSVKKGRVKKIDFTGKTVYVGVDLSFSDDNCSVAVIAADDDNNILCDVHGFVPEDRIEEKNTYEKVDYYQFIRAGKVTACGDVTVGYSTIENFVFEIENAYGCTVAGIGFDRWNALSSAQKWDRDYKTVEVRQHSDTLHPPTKLLKEKILSGGFFYEENTLLEINFENAKCTRDTNMNLYINKKRSNGKVDMIFSILNALYLLQQDIIFGDEDWVQVV